MRLAIGRLPVVIALFPLILSCSSDETTEPEPEAEKNPVLWEVGSSNRLKADDFFIEAGNQKFLANTENVNVRGDTGGERRTIEIEWTEHGAEMRFYMYFTVTDTHWWVHEMRTYDGDQGNPSWIYYYGDAELFKSEMRSSYQGDVDLLSDESDRGVPGRLYIDNMELGPLYP
jgi:hypothetical protein